MGELHMGTKKCREERGAAQKRHRQKKVCLALCCVGRRGLGREICVVYGKCDRKEKVGKGRV